MIEPKIWKPIKNELEQKYSSAEFYQSYKDGTWRKYFDAEKAVRRINTEEAIKKYLTQRLK